MELQVGFKYWEYFKLTLKGFFLVGGWWRVTTISQFCIDVGWANNTQ